MQVSEKENDGSVFDRFPDLRRHLLEMAQNGYTGSFARWNAFIDCLEAALSLPAPAGEVGELIERLTKEEERMQRLWGACDEAFQKYRGTPAAFDINGLKHAVGGRDPVLTDAAAALRYQASRIEQLERERAAAKEVLRKHHRWHDGIGVVKFTEDGQEIELDLSAEYGDSTLYEETVEALK